METKNQELEAVLEKLKKLKNLYEGAKSIKSEGEANAAAAAIQRLLTQYNLSMEELDLSEKPKNKVSEERAYGYTYKSIGGDWEMKLLNTLCIFNFCKCIKIGKNGYDMIILGKKENLEVVKWLRSMLSEKFVELSKIRFKEYKETNEFKQKPISKDKFQRSYLSGCTLGLYSKLEKEREEETRVEDMGSKVTTLVVRTNEELKNYISERFGKLSDTGGSKLHRDSSYYSAKNLGIRDGMKAELNKPIVNK